MKTGFVAELQHEMWAMEPRALDAFFRQVAERSGDAQPAAATETDTRNSRMQIEDGVAVIPITGILMKDVPFFFSFFGIEATSYADIRHDLQAALEDDTVGSVLLHIDSPGGVVSGILETGDALFAARDTKPVRAFIEDLGASGAYWLASQAEEITANLNTEVGSIGVYTVYIDYAGEAEKLGIKVHVIRSGEHKGMGVAGAPITDTQIAATQEVIDGLAGNFVAAISRGRGMAAQPIKELATGRVWLAPEAKELGLIDHVDTFESVLAGGRSVSQSGQEEKVMAEKQSTAAPDTDAIEKKAADDARTGELQRLKDLRVAFPDDDDFAIAQYESGASVADAKVAYNDVLREKLAASEAKTAELEKKPDGDTAPPAKAGAPPVVHGEAAEDTDLDFMAVSRSLAAEKDISMTEAMRRTAKANAELHEAFKADASAQSRKI